jgi:hypothetical protein
MEEVDEEEPPQIILEVPGALYIRNYGCAIRFFLIVTGQCLGEVWRDSQADDAGIAPECSRDGSHFTLLDWYENWTRQLKSPAAPLRTLTKPLCVLAPWRAQFKMPNQTTFLRK